MNKRLKIVSGIGCLLAFSSYSYTRNNKSIFSSYFNISSNINLYFPKNNIIYADEILINQSISIIDENKPKTPIITKIYENIKHYLRIGYLLIKFLPSGLLYPIIKFIPLPTIVVEKYWDFLVWTIESSGPTFIKLGQWMSTRIDLFSQDFCNHMKRLHSSTKEHQLSHTIQVIKEVFHLNDLNELFLDIDPKPVGSGCIGQVYKAKMLLSKVTNEIIKDQDEDMVMNVAIKVLHPNMAKSIKRDVRILRALAWLYNTFVPSYVSRWIDASESIEQFIYLLEQQLDLRKEASNLVKFSMNFKDNKDITFPTPLYPYVHENILIETFEDGLSMDELISTKDPMNPSIAEKGMNMLMEMVLAHNFVHGDLHPGNILVRKIKDNTDCQLIILDAGIVVELSEQDKVNFEDLFFAIVNNDGEQCGKLMLERARFHECSTPNDFMAEMKRIVDKNSNLELDKVDIGAVLLEVTLLSCKHQLKLETRFVSLMISIMILEGLGRSLDPHTNILSIPYILDRNVTRKLLRAKGIQWFKAKYWQAVQLWRQFLTNLLEDDKHSIELALIKAKVEVEHAKKDNEKKQKEKTIEH